MYQYESGSGAMWRDKLTGYTMTNSSGHTYTFNFVYDQIGNPLTYENGAMTWAGRTMLTCNRSAYQSSYTYDVNGMRRTQAVYYPSVGVTWDFNYEYDGTKLIHKTGYNFEAWYEYDETGSPIAMILTVGSTTSKYYLIKNMQGDVIALADETGAICRRYTYDAWGKITSITTATGNPVSEIAFSDPAIANHFRYRGYFYDDCTNLYQLETRYYDPNTGRFVNADGQLDLGSITGTNLFTYCGNNPVKYL